jgi:hypothetical protein
MVESVKVSLWISERTMNITSILPYLNSLGLLGLAAAIFYTQFSTGARQVNSEVLANYKALDEQKTQQISNYEKDIAEIKNAMRTMEKDFIERIAKMEGQLKEKNSQIDSLNVILANRNPDLEKILGEIRDFMKDIHFANLHQTEILDNQVVREKSIDANNNK